MPIHQGVNVLFSPSHNTKASQGAADGAPRHSLLLASLVAVAAALLVSGCAVKVPQTITPVSAFDVNKYAGKWYELARIDHSFEKGLVNTSAEYSLNADGTVKVLNRGYNPEKKAWKASEGKAKFLGDPTVAALKVSFFGPFYGGYNVVDLSPDYQTALVIGNHLDYFWLLSRQKELLPQQVEALLAKAKSMGVDMNKVIRVPQE